MATVKKSVKKTAAKKQAVKRTLARRVVHCECDCCKCGDGCVCSCKNCNCRSKNDSVKYTNMFAAFRAFWYRGFTEWAGTSSRSEYWLAFFANILIYLAFVVLFVCTAILDDALFKDGAVFSVMTMGGMLLYVIAGIIPSISMLTRRMHDAGLSAWFWLLYLLSFIPTVGAFIWCISVLVITLLPTQKADNPYHKYNK